MVVYVVYLVENLYGIPQFSPKAFCMVVPEQ